MSFYGETFKIYHSNSTIFEYLFIYTLLNYFYLQTIIMNVSYVISYKINSHGLFSSATNNLLLISMLK